MGTAFAIGVSGHRDLVNEETCHFVAQQFRALLREYKQRKDALVLYSALARGADQLFMQIALEEHVPFEVVLPCTHYETSFTSQKELAEYHYLLHACRNIHQLPFTLCSNDSYLAAGQWIVDHSGLLLLAWNGLPSRGRGGTADVAAYARSVSRPYIHIHTRDHTVKSYTSTSTHLHASGQMTEMLPLSTQKYVRPHENGTNLIPVKPTASTVVVPIGQNENVLLIEVYNSASGMNQLTLPVISLEDTMTIDEQTQHELRFTTGYRAKKLQKLQTFPIYSSQQVAHSVHVFAAYDLEWDPPVDGATERQVMTYTLEDALAETLIDHRCNSKAALALWLYAQDKFQNSSR